MPFMTPNQLHGFTKYITRLFPSSKSCKLLNIVSTSTPSFILSQSVIRTTKGRFPGFHRISLTYQGFQGGLLVCCMIFYMSDVVFVCFVTLRVAYPTFWYSRNMHHKRSVCAPQKDSQLYPDFSPIVFQIMNSYLGVQLTLTYCT